MNIKKEKYSEKKTYKNNFDLYIYLICCQCLGPEGKLHEARIFL